jgi:hypothetical protein
MTPPVVLMPIGPGEAELARARDSLASVRRHEPAAEPVLVDDGPAARDLSALTDGPVVRTALRGGWVPDRDSAMLAGTLAGLRAARSLDPAFVLKLDTDALVIAPFAEPIRAALAARPSAGLLGSYDRLCTGAPRDWSLWDGPLAAAARPLRLFPRRHGSRIPRGWRRTRAERRHVRTTLAAARARGYRPGEHCLGGAYAVAPALVASPLLDAWRPWVGTRLAEDVLLGILCRAAGLEPAGLVGPGEPFALAWRGLPAEPSRLLAAGHAIVHSVAGREEAELRAWFRARAEVAA